MDGEKAFVGVKRELEDDNHLIIDEDCTDDESEPTMKRVKIEPVEFDCPRGDDPTVDTSHMHDCKFCNEQVSRDMVKHLVCGTPLPTKSLPLCMLYYMAVRRLITMTSPDRIDITLRNSIIPHATAIAKLQNGINSGLERMKTSITSVDMAVKILKIARLDNIPKLITLAEDQMRWLASAVETCAQVYAVCDDLMPAIKSVALETFKKHLANRFVKLECSICGPTPIHTRACEHRRCKYVFKMERDFDVCADGHINDDKLFGCRRNKCRGIIKKIPRRVYTSSVPDSVIAELFRLSQE